MVLSKWSPCLAYIVYSVSNVVVQPIHLLVPTTEHPFSPISDVVPPAVMRLFNKYV